MTAFFMGEDHDFSKIKSTNSAFKIIVNKKLNGLQVIQ